MRIGALVLGSLMSLQGYYPPTIPAQASQACGNGVVIRADGAVMVDEWRGYDATLPSQQKLLPTSVTLGKSLKNPVNVCVEFENGTLCADIGRLRALIEANVTPAGAKTVK